VQFNLAAAIPLISLISYGTLLILVFRRGVRDSESGYFSLYLFSMFIASLGGFMIYAQPSRVATWSNVMMGGTTVWPLAFYGFVWAFLGRESSKWWLYVGWPWMIGSLVIAASGGVASNLHFAEDGLIHYELGSGTPVYAPYWLIYMGLSAFRLIQSRGRPEYRAARDRITYATLGIIVVVIGSFSNLAPALGAYPLDLAAHVINALLLTYALGRYRLLDIGFAVRRALSYLLPGGMLGAGYFVITYLALNLFSRARTQYQMLILAAIVSAVAGAVVYFLRDVVQSLVRRLLFPEQHDASLVLERISRTATGVLDASRLAEMILGEITDALRITFAAFYLKREGTGEYHLAASRGMDLPAEDRLRPAHPLVEWLTSHTGHLTRDEMESMPQFLALWTQEREVLDKLQAELFIPLHVREELIGILVLGSKEGHAAYSSEEQLTLNTMANQTAAAVEIARLFSHEERELAQSAALLDIARAVGSILDLNRVLDIVALKTAQVCEVNRCTILLLEEEGRRLVLLVSRSRDGAQNSGLWQALEGESGGEGIDKIPLVQRVIRDRNPMVVSEGLSTLVPSSWLDSSNVASLLTVPLVSKDNVIGLMALDRAEKGLGFTDEQVDLATTIGSQVAIAIENARLYEEVVREKNRTETIVDQAFTGIMVIDSDMRILTVNPAAETVTGYAGGEILGMRLQELFGPELWDDGSPMERALAGVGIVGPTEATLAVGGGKRDVLLGIAPLRSGYLLSFADITELKEVDRVKSNLVANVSHELRQPLASIKAYSELLLDDLADDGQSVSRRFLEVIDRESDRLAGLLNDLLDISRLEQRKVAPPTNPLSVRSLVEDAVSLLGVQANERGISIKLEIDPDLPMIQANKDLVMTMVRNLLGNAIKFSYEDGTVLVRARAKGSNAVVDFIDDGMGVAEKEIPQLFSKFYRTQAALDAGITGTGLGLVLAREAVRAHGGNIKVVSELGVGSQFIVTLPLVEPDSEKAVADNGTERAQVLAPVSEAVV